MTAYVDALGRRRAPRPTLDPARILDPQTARAIFGLREASR